MNSGEGVLGVDPGRRKAGFALLDACGNVVVSGIEPIERLPESLRRLVRERDIPVIALGRGTNAREVKAALGGLRAPHSFGGRI